VSLHDEPRAVAERYARRTPGDRYHPLQPAVWQERQGRQRALVKLLQNHAGRPIDQLRLLEVGCGSGDNLLEMLQLGFDPAHLVGNELLPERATAARRRLPMATEVTGGDALAQPFAPESFDIVLQSTVFSSLLDDAFQQRLATQMWQWVRPGGAVLWYDFTFDNPRNPDVRGVPLQRIRALFPQAHVTARRVTLAPPLARVLCRLHPALYTVFNALPPLRTHVLAWLAKPGR
jgi:SAM-dependent methyltransferase